MQLILQKKENCAFAIGAPLRVKVLRVCCDSFQVITTPSVERQTIWASTPSNLLIKRPLLIECRRTSDEWEQETTTPRSELTQQPSISLRCPRSTCIGPSIRRLLSFSIKFVELLLVEDGLPIPLECSECHKVKDGDLILCFLVRDPHPFYSTTIHLPNLCVQWPDDDMFAKSHDLFPNVFTKMGGIGFLLGAFSCSRSSQTNSAPLVFLRKEMIMPSIVMLVL